jgi:hypothetical protein
MLGRAACKNYSQTRSRLHADIPFLSWLYCSEIAPLEYRHIGGAATAFGEWLMTFITVFAGPIGLTNIGWKFWLWVFSGNVVAILFV